MSLGAEVLTLCSDAVRIFYTDIFEKKMTISVLNLIEMLGNNLKSVASFIQIKLFLALKNYVSVCLESAVNRFIQHVYIVKHKIIYDI